MKPLSENVGIIKSNLRSYNQKDYGKDIDHLETKMNLYAEKEVIKNIHFSNIRIILSMLCIPVIHFFGWGIVHGLFFRGIR
jgi:hypothetical protein